MKLMIASDLHGSLYYTELLLNKFNSLGYDKLILLGDIYYHGPRNPLTKDYNPQELASKLNSIKEKLIVIKGNCDSEVDQMISEFTFTKNHSLKYNGLKLFFTHGHVYNEDNLPKAEIDAIFYGHFHVGFIKMLKCGIIVANPGSISLPKNNIHSYITIEDNQITLKNLINDEVISYLKLK